MNVIKERENTFLRLISNTVNDIVKEKNFLTSTSLKIKYCLKDMSKIRVNIFYDNDKLGKTDKKNNIISFLITPENKLIDIHVGFENCTNFGLNKEKLENLKSKVKEKIKSLFKMSSLTYAEVKVLTGNRGKTSFDKFLDLLNATLEDIFKDYDVKPWVTNGEVYSVPNGILIKAILEGNQSIDCYINGNFNKISICPRRLDFEKQLYSELESKLPYLLKNSELDFEKLKSLAQQMAEKRANLSEKKLQNKYYQDDFETTVPSEEFKKFRRFKELLDEFIQKTIEDYDGLQVPICDIKYLYPARIEVWSKIKSSSKKDPWAPVKIISFNINPYSAPGSSFNYFLLDVDVSNDFLLDVDVSLEKCLNSNAFYGNLQEEDIKIKNVLPELLYKSNLNFSDVKKWASFSYSNHSTNYSVHSIIEVFVRHLCDFLSRLDIINSDLLQHMYFGCERYDDEITVEAFSDEPDGFLDDVVELFSFSVSHKNDISIDSIDIYSELIKNDKHLSAEKYHEVLDTLNIIKKELVFLLNYYNLDYDFWSSGYPSSDYGVEQIDEYGAERLEYHFEDDDYFGNIVFDAEEFYKYSQDVALNDNNLNKDSDGYVSGSDDIFLF